jgi:hypothetical protein
MPHMTLVGLFSPSLHFNIRIDVFQPRSLGHRIAHYPLSLSLSTPHPLPSPHPPHFTLSTPLHPSPSPSPPHPRSYGNAACIYTTVGAHAEWFTERFSVGMVGVNIGVPVRVCGLCDVVLSVLVCVGG